VKAFTADIRPGRRPRGRARDELVLQYQRRAGIDATTGMGVRT
jgi:formate dehydrogenase major subunit